MNDRVIAMLAMAGIMGGRSYPRRDRRSSQEIRYDPKRKKTPRDLERIEAARLKRLRKHSTKEKPHE